jgi:hypothetical protein
LHGATRAALAATALALACARAEPGAPNASRELAAELAADRALPRHAADGGGRAWLEDAPAGGAGAPQPGRVVVV